jgi:D-tyrosyl-tRNA(Tyr) deacylase
MRAVIQRVSRASVKIDGKVSGAINQGFLILLGIEQEDTKEDALWLSQKIASLRIFGDDEGKMNLDLHGVDGRTLVVSQFTLHAKYKKGTRPSFIRAAHPDVAIPLYDMFILNLQEATGQKVESGEFGAMMTVELVNDGPVTIIIDTKNKD